MFTTKIGVDGAATYLNGAFQTGWIPGEQEDLSSPTLKKPVTVEYVAPNQIKIVGLDWSDRIQQGTKIRYKQGGEYKYDFVSEVSFATDSTLTLMGGSTVEDETITEFWFSNIATPIGWPFGVDYIEGFNANGTWKKWIDGALECWGKFSNTYTNTPKIYGNIWYDNTAKTIVYPHEFYVVPNFITQLASPGIGGVIISDTAETAYCYIYIWNGSATGDFSYTVCWKATGRWKA